MTLKKCSFIGTKQRDAAPHIVSQKYGTIFFAFNAHKIIIVNAEEYRHSNSINKSEKSLQNLLIGFAGFIESIFRKVITAYFA